MTPQALVRNTMLRVKSAKLDRYIAGAERSREVQEAGLLRRIRQNRDSQFGRDHGFAEIRNIEDFRSRVPVSDYEYHRPYIQQVMHGHVDALFAPGTKIWMYAQTSGTTADSKFIPVTDRFYRQYKAGWQAWGTSLYRAYPHLIHRQTLQFTSNWKTSYAPDGIPCGNISGLAAETRPFYMNSMFVLPSTVMEIKDSFAKHYTALRLSLASDRVGMIITANPSTLVRVAKRADEMKEDLIRDIRDGTLSESIDVPASVRERLRSRLRSDPDRAKELSDLIKTKETLNLLDAWPGLEMLAVWTGGSVGSYLGQLKKRIGSTHIRDHGISASEGRMTLPLRDGRSDGMIDYTSHFYEFIPVDQHDEDNPEVLLAHELTPGEDYFILLTTDSGLYRYDIHDLVRCHGFQGQAPMLSFLNKGANCSSFTGEKLFEYQVNLAMQRTCDSFGVTNGTFTLAPEMIEMPQYHLVVTDSLVEECGDAFIREFERHLKSINLEYDDKCDSGRILPIVGVPVSQAVWAEMRRRKTAARGNFEEYKHPCLTSDLEFLPKIRSIVAELQPVNS
ncbi:MAG: GH3 auxin-responsive promoter family protein [Planctomycetota bacterium]